MYSPLKRHLYRAQQIIPSKNCSNPKIIPSQAPLVAPYNLYQRPMMVHNGEVVKNSRSMPQLKKIDNCVEEYFEYDRYYNPYDSKMVVYQANNLIKSHREPPQPNIDDDQQFSRPFTPPDKRYNSATFGQTTEQSGVRTRDNPKKHQRPRSSCVYENVHVTSDDFCNHNGKHVRFNRNNLPNVKLDGYPRAEFSQMYVQSGLD